MFKNSGLASISGIHQVKNTTTTSLSRFLLIPVSRRSSTEVCHRQLLIFLDCAKGPATVVATEFSLSGVGYRSFKCPYIQLITDVPLFSVGGELISCVVTNLITENTVVRYSDTTFSLSLLLYNI